MTIRSVEDIRRDHDDFRRWQNRPNRHRVPKPMPANWHDVGLLLKYAEGLEKLRAQNERLTAEVSSLRTELDDANAMLDYHVREPVDCQDPFLEIGEWLASRLQEHEWNEVEPMINGLREHFRKIAVSSQQEPRK